MASQETSNVAFSLSRHFSGTKLGHAAGTFAEQSFKLLVRGLTRVPKTKNKTAKVSMF